MFRSGRRWVIALTVLAALLVGAPPVTAATGARGDAIAVTRWAKGDPVFDRPSRGPRIAGVNYHGMWRDMTAPMRARVLDRLAAAGVEWVRLDVAWAMVQPDGPDRYDLNWGVPQVDRRIDEIAARGMKTLLLFYWAPRWSTGTDAKNGVPRDAAEYGRAAAWAADRWRGKVHAIELWNEPDLPGFLANTSVRTYTDLVTEAYPRIKAVNPAVTVVAGAPTYVNSSWFERFYELGGAGSYDALGIHPYMGQLDDAPTVCRREWREYHPCGIADLVKLMRANGDGDKQIWATEYGWSSHDNSSYRGRPQNWEAGVSRATQARYLLAMQEVLGRYPQVTASFWYNDRNTAAGDAKEDNLGLLNRDGSPKPAYFAMRCAAGGICGPTRTRR